MICAYYTPIEGICQEFFEKKWDRFEKNERIYVWTDHSADTIQKMKKGEFFFKFFEKALDKTQPMVYNIAREFCKRSLTLTYTEMYSRGRRGAPAKGVGRVTGARVQISPSPPVKSTTVMLWTFPFAIKGFLGLAEAVWAVWGRTACVVECDMQGRDMLIGAKMAKKQAKVLWINCKFRNCGVEFLGEGNFGGEIWARKL